MLASGDNAKPRVRHGATDEVGHLKSSPVSGTGHAMKSDAAPPAVSHPPALIPSGGPGVRNLPDGFGNVPARSGISRVDPEADIGRACLPACKLQLSPDQAERGLENACILQP